MAKFNEESKTWESAVKFPYPYLMDVYIGQEILKKLKETPDRVALIFHEENFELTCNELRISSIRIAQNLITLGIKPDDVVGVICKNSSQVTYLVNACALIGAPVNPLDLSFYANDIKNLFGQTLPKIIVCDIEIVDRVEEALRGLKSDAKVFVTGPEKVKGTSSFKELLEPTGVEESFISPKFAQKADKKLVAILCSSGTTGMPKGVKITHAQCLRVTGFPRAPTKKVNLGFSPIFWSTGFFNLLFTAFAQSDTRVISSKGFSMESFTAIVEKHKVTDLLLAPMHLISILQSDFPRSKAQESLKIFGSVGSITSESLRQKFSEIFPDKDLRIAYGMTEGMISATGPGDYKDKLTVGTIFPNVTLKIVDESQNKLGVDEVGEICMKGLFRFPGYYNNPEATENLLDDDGFIKTGDVGYMNEKGSLFLIDRKKEIMRCKTYHVNPSEIESIIEQIEGVAHVAVVGVPDPIATNLAAAVIVKRSGFNDLTEQLVKDFVAGKLQEYKHLHGGVFFVDELPVTPSGKVKKRLLMDIVTSRL